MRKLINRVWLAALCLIASAAFAQPVGPDDRYERRTFSQAELDQMLAPIALYPDSLLSQILMAATYPQDLAEAASWSRVNRGVRGDAAVRAVEGRDWDPSVVSLVAFPEVLEMLDERRDWTERLAEAYIEQHEQVLDTIQGLRRRADEAGSLRSSEEIVVHREGDQYVIEPPTTEIVYVPYYDPRYTYGTWWWPSYQPIWWRPWAGYGYRPGYRGYCWGPRVSVGRHFFFGHFDWGNRYVRWSGHRPWYVRGDNWRAGHRWVRDERRGPHRWSDADRQRWREGDRNRWRDGDRNRWRDGDRDRRDRPDGDRDRRRAETGGSSGFFRDDDRSRAAQPRYPQISPGAATYRGDADTSERRRAPMTREPVAQPQPRTSSGFARPVEVQRAPVVVDRPAPVTRAPSAQRPQAPQAIERPQAVERPQRPEAPARTAPAARSESDRSERSSSGGGSSGLGRGGGGDRR